MFTIQYVAVNGESRMVEFDTKSRVRLTAYLARFEHPILGVYEQSTPITKTMRSALQTCPFSLSKYAREFAYPMNPG